MLLAAVRRLYTLVTRRDSESPLLKTRETDTRGGVDGGGGGGRGREGVGDQPVSSSLLVKSSRVWLRRPRSFPRYTILLGEENPRIVHSLASPNSRHARRTKRTFSRRERSTCFLACLAFVPRRQRAVSTCALYVCFAVGEDAVRDEERHEARWCGLLATVAACLPFLLCRNGCTKLRRGACCVCVCVSTLAPGEEVAVTNNGCFGVRWKGGCGRGCCFVGRRSRDGGSKGWDGGLV